MLMQLSSLQPLKASRKTWARLRGEILIRHSMAADARGSPPCVRAPDSYIALKRAPTSRRARPHYSGAMNDGIYFADPNEPLHVWVRVLTTDRGYGWARREARPGGPEAPPAIGAREPWGAGREGS